MTQAPEQDAMDDKTPADQMDPATRPDTTMTNSRAATEFLKALAHEGRLMILCHLVHGEKAVGELEALLGARQAAVSQQLARLRHEGLVTSRRDGKTIYYSIGDPKIRQLIETLDALFCDEPVEAAT
jgi:ArsR family transcriptional regulator, virulence genes transcriptional regulator